MTIHRNSRNLHLKDRIGWYIPHRSFSTFSFGHCVVCSSLIYGFWLPLWYLQTLLLTIVLSVLLWFTYSDYPFGVFKLFFWPLCCLFFLDLRILITPLISSNSSNDHCVVCSSFIYGFWLPLWCLQALLLAIVLSVLLRFTDSDYPFGIFKLFLIYVYYTLRADHYYSFEFESVWRYQRNCLKP